jgi:hypothetical protein
VHLVGFNTKKVDYTLCPMATLLVSCRDSKQRRYPCNFDQEYGGSM